MELILISSPVAIPDELNRLNDYFSQGLKLFHLRKPYYSLEKIAEYLDNINPQFYPKIALHSHHSLGEKYDINRLHYTEDLRSITSKMTIADQVAEGKIISTSIHSIEMLRKLTDLFAYSFLGPVFPSISKQGYGDSFDPEKWLKIKSNAPKAIGIGGIKSTNIQALKKLGFSGAAVLGTIWSQSHNGALEELSACLKQCEPTYYE